MILTIPLVIWTLLSLPYNTHAGVTVYSQQPIGIATATASGNAANYTGSAAYDPTVLTPPPVPQPPPPNAFRLDLQNTAAAVSGVSIQQSGSFVGFSIEMSVAVQVSEYAYLADNFISLTSE